MKNQRFVSIFTSLVAASAAAACTDGEEEALPQSCADIVDLDPDARDGEYDLYIGGDPDKKWTAYCKDMNRTPSEFLSLVRTSDEYNYSSIRVRVDDGTGVAKEEQVKTSFAKVRIDPVLLTVDIGDLTFTNTSSPEDDVQVGDPEDPVTVKKMPFGVAASCVQFEGGAVSSGSANVDLSGTSFVINQTWCTGGDSAKEISPTFSNDDTAVTFTAGTKDTMTAGSCAWAQPSVDECDASRPFNQASGKLQLDYVRQR